MASIIPVSTIKGIFSAANLKNRLGALGEAWAAGRFAGVWNLAGSDILGGAGIGALIGFGIGSGVQAVDSMFRGEFSLRDTLYAGFGGAAYGALGGAGYGLLLGGRGAAQVVAAATPNTAATVTEVASAAAAPAAATVAGIGFGTRIKRWLSPSWRRAGRELDEALRFGLSRRKYGDLSRQAYREAVAEVSDLAAGMEDRLMDYTDRASRHLRRMMGFSGYVHPRDPWLGLAS